MRNAAGAPPGEAFRNMVGADTMAIDDILLTLLASGCAVEWTDVRFRVQIRDSWIKIEDDPPVVNEPDLVEAA
jgi:hypothetical protein